MVECGQILLMTHTLDTILYGDRSESAVLMTCQVVDMDAFYASVEERDDPALVRYRTFNADQCCQRPFERFK